MKVRRENPAFCVEKKKFTAWSTCLIGLTWGPRARIPRGLACENVMSPVFLLSEVKYECCGHAFNIRLWKIQFFGCAEQLILIVALLFLFTPTAYMF